MGVALGPQINWSFDEAGQASMLVESVKRLRAMPDVDATIVHTLVDGGDGLGVLRSNLSARPAYCALGRINGRAPCGSGTGYTSGFGTNQNYFWAAQDAVQAAADAALGYRRTHGAFAAVSGAKPAQIDPRIKPMDTSRDYLPGPYIDPWRIGVWSIDGGQGILLCNTSKYERSYCIVTHGDGEWTYGYQKGSVWKTAARRLPGAPVPRAPEPGRSREVG